MPVENLEKVISGRKALDWKMSEKFCSLVRKVEERFFAIRQNFRFSTCSRLLCHHEKKRKIWGGSGLFGKKVTPLAFSISQCIWLLKTCFAAGLMMTNKVKKGLILKRPLLWPWRTSGAWGIMLTLLAAVFSKKLHLVFATRSESWGESSSYSIFQTFSRLETIEPLLMDPKTS